MKLEQINARQTEIADFSVGISINALGTNYYYTDLVGDDGTYYFDSLGAMMAKLETKLKNKDKGVSK